MDFNNEEMNSSPENSPTGLYGSRPAEILRNSYGSGNREIVRHLRTRVRIAEDRVSRFQSSINDLRLENKKLSRELEENRDVLANTKKAFQARIEALQKELSKQKSENSNARVEGLISLFNTPTESKLCPSFQIPEKICFDASVGTEPEPSCSRTIVETKSQDQGVTADLDDYHQIDNRFEERTKLEANNFFLETQLKLAQSKINHYGVQEVQMRTMENRIVALSDIVDRLIVENEKLKEMAASKMNSGCGDGPASRNLVDLTLEYQTKIHNKTAEVELKTKQIEELTRIHNAALVSLETMKEKCSALEKKIAEVSAVQTVVQEDSSDKEELRRCLEENAQLKERLSKYENKPASDTTKIFHFRMNPLDVAHEEYREFESQRKRKAEVSLLCDPNGLDAAVRKKQLEELMKQVSDLQFQLHKTKKDAEKAVKLQSDLIWQYRGLVFALTGWQIKMKDDGFAEVESIFDLGHFFYFKVEKLSKPVNSLETEVSLLESEYAKEWAKEIGEYLECRDSVPAFLAAVTLVLQERLHTSKLTTTLSFTSTL